MSACRHLQLDSVACYDIQYDKVYFTCLYSRLKIISYFGSTGTPSFDMIQNHLNYFNIMDQQQ